MHYIIVLKKKEIYGWCKLYFNALEKQINLKLNYIYCPKANSNLWWMWRVIVKDKKYAASWKPWGMSSISKSWPETTSVRFVLFLWCCYNGCEGHTDDACVGQTLKRQLLLQSIRKLLCSSSVTSTFEGYWLNMVASN